MELYQIPCIDFGSYIQSESAKVSTADAVVRALRKYSTFYLVNHGVAEQEIEDVFSQSRKFFPLPSDVKNASIRAAGIEPKSGYVGSDVEYNSVEADHSVVIPEIREAFDVVLHQPPPASHPETIELISSMKVLSESCLKLVRQIFDCISSVEPLGQMELQQGHQHMGDINKNSTMMRTLWYPPMSETQLTDHTRIAPHTDFGTISLIFQHGVGGLEVDPNRGHFVPAPPASGSVLVIAADVLEYWTSGQVKATKHRVVPNPEVYQETRQSIVFFVDPDYDAPIVPIGQQDLHAPVKYGKDIVFHRYELAFAHAANSTSQAELVHDNEE